MASITQCQGTCLCGTVSVTVTTKGNHVGVCHCSMCRKWGGGPMFAVECADDVAFQGAEHISIFSSSEWAERGFCQQCGTHLFYRLKQNRHYALPVGLLDSTDDWKVTEQIFIDQKPEYYSLAEKTKQLTGEEVFAQYVE
ncbi:MULTISPECIES: GFA family protein [unclassified Halomonas]|uniref:GFA family protein n=1 Tax=unclassified Halomonas TaxID=2609666 RepID=UPI0009903D38|nr:MULTISPECIES: GFA family protein [unclassified Halomonas]AQU82624.1 aldehyde-activating protein [Halomonas sp. 'Soap Lake \